jgi:triacylglycerol esterase/lipase EstA (alpha/beta hydrolase family)
MEWTYTTTDSEGYTETFTDRTTTVDGSAITITSNDQSFSTSSWIDSDPTMNFSEWVTSTVDTYTEWDSSMTETYTYTTTTEITDRTSTVTLTNSSGS